MPPDVAIVRYRLIEQFYPPRDPHQQLRAFLVTDRAERADGLRQMLARFVALFRNQLLRQLGIILGWHDRENG